MNSRLFMHTHNIEFEKKYSYFTAKSWNYKQKRFDFVSISFSLLHKLFNLAIEQESHNKSVLLIAIVILFDR